MVSECITRGVACLSLALLGRLELLLAVLSLLHLLYQVKLVLTLHALAACHVGTLDSLILTGDLLGEYRTFCSRPGLVLFPKFHLSFGLSQLFIKFFSLLFALLYHASHPLELFIVLPLALFYLKFARSCIFSLLILKA